MSSPLGHALGATIVYAASSKLIRLPRLTRWHYLGIALLACLPDVDAALLSSMSHRGVTHGILVTLLISFLFYRLFRSAKGEDISQTGLVLCALSCAAAHPIMDTLGCPERPVHWLAPFRYSEQGIDAYWTMLPQPYFKIVGGNEFYLPWSAIVDNIPQIICEFLFLSCILVSLTLPRKKAPISIGPYLAFMIACLVWIGWRMFFPTVWMR